nr:unnamed protein product [Digitaria exilis]
MFFPLLPSLGRRHCAATVREDDGGTAGGGAAEVAAGEGGYAGWPWPWELVRWRRHLNDPACVAGAHTHLGAAPWPWAEEMDDQLRRMCFGDAPVGVVLWWWPWAWNLPSSAAVST